jgi:tagatose 1,6-diphosphate aldolase
VSVIDVFRFLDAGRLVDGELELIEPCHAHIDDVLTACTHPLTVVDAPNDAKTTREHLLNFLKAAPRGRFPGEPESQRVPSYSFWMRLRDLPRRPAPLRIAGGCTLRVGRTDGIELYYGNIGYHVYPPARGRRYAERACRLLIPLFRRHGQRTLWITCGPENVASRRTCERLGMEFLGIVPVPTDDPLFERGEREKCRYRLEM